MEMKSRKTIKESFLSKESTQYNTMTDADESMTGVLFGVTCDFSYTKIYDSLLMAVAAWLIAHGLSKRLEKLHLKNRIRVHA